MKASTNQLRVVYVALACLGVYLYLQNTHPSLWGTIFGLACLAFVSLSLAKIIRIPRIPFVLLIVGGLLNFAVLLANKGFMPCILVEGVEGKYISMYEARLTFLGDWIGGFVSPGDVLVVIGAIGLIGAILRRHLHKQRGLLQNT